MSNELGLGTWHEIYSDDPDYRAEGMAIDLAQQIAFKMDALEMSRSELAELLGVNRAYVSKVLNAPPNLTLRSIAAVAIALGIKVEPKVILDPGDWILIGKGLRPVLGMSDFTSGIDLSAADDDQVNRPPNVIPFPVPADTASDGYPNQTEQAGG
jgi:transcriptional regulator with XRE-family HTH domain